MFGRPTMVGTQVVGVMLFCSQQSSVGIKGYEFDEDVPRTLPLPPQRQLLFWSAFPLFLVLSFEVREAARQARSRIIVNRRKLTVYLTVKFENLDIELIPLARSMLVEVLV